MQGDNNYSMPISPQNYVYYMSWNFYCSELNHEGYFIISTLQITFEVQYTG